MLEKIRKMKNKKGFTLVELIVVLVILAILAALLVPALTGYIDRANNQKIIAETRSVVMAAQTVASEKYATATDNLSIGDEDGTNVITLKSITDLAEVTGKGTLSNVTFQKAGDSKFAGQIHTLTWTSGSKQCTYDATKTGDAMYDVSAAGSSDDGE